jgi:Transposase DDE domain group 1
VNRRFRRISDLPPGEKRALLVKLLQKRAGGAMWFLDQLGTTVTELQAEAELDPTIRPEAVPLPANANLERDIAELLTRPVGRPSHKPAVWYKSFHYQAARWKTARRVVAKVEHHQGELFPRVGFIVTHLILPSRAVVRFYHTRGTAAPWLKEGQQAVKMTRLSCHRC